MDNVVFKLRGCMYVCMYVWDNVERMCMYYYGVRMILQLENRKRRERGKLVVEKGERNLP